MNDKWTVICSTNMNMFHEPTEDSWEYDSFDDAKQFFQKKISTDLDVRDYIFSVFEKYDLI